MVKILPVAMLAGAVVCGTYVSAQDTPMVVGKPRYTAEAMRQREATSTCRLPDKTEHLVGTSVALAGKTHRCVTVLSENFTPVGAAWTPVE